MTINAFNVSYPDFELGTIINPDELDVNFADIMIRINQIIDVVNHLTDGLITDNGDGTVTDSSGADLVDINSIAGFTSPKLQTFLEEVVAKLQSIDGGGLSGASFIGASAIPGVVGDSVQEQLESLKTLLDGVVTQHTADNDAINARATQIESDASVLTDRVTATELEIDSLQVDKLGVGEAYNKTQTDTAIAQLENQVYQDMYTKTESDTLLGENLTKDHIGTWQGINVSDIADVVGASGVAIQNTAPSTPYERLLWFNPSNNEYRLYLNGQWRINTRPTQIKKVHNRVTLGADATVVGIGIPDFNPLYDAFIVMQNSVFIAEGFEYSASGANITLATTATAGTVFDFIAFIAQPAT